jgi:hypothetical protein
MPWLIYTEGLVRCVAWCADGILKSCKLIILELHKESAALLSAQLLLKSRVKLLTSFALSFKSMGVMASRSTVRPDLLKNKTI